MRVRQREPADAAIHEDDEFIAEALKSASLPTLMMSLVHITGDTGLLRGRIRPGKALPGDSHGSLSDQDKSEVRGLALEALKAYRDGGCQLPPPPSDETIREMMSFAVGEEVPSDYVPMMLEELALDGEDSRNLNWDDVASEAKQSFHVLVIGAGMSGLLTAIRLEEAGIPYTVIEKNETVGGTWLENAYPGCRVDVANHFYCYSFEPNPEWSEYFCRQQELLAYFERCSTRYGVRERIRFETEVVAAHFDEEASRWRVEIRSKDGTTETLSCNVLVSAVGQLNRPKLPDLPGIDSFGGRSFHSAAWDDQVCVEGRRVAVIGTGASALQLVPEVARIAEHLAVFQRQPAWMLPNPNYHRRVSDGKRWLLEHVPFYARWYRFLLFWPGSDGLLPSLVVDPEWPHPERSVNAANDQIRRMFTEYMKSQLGDDSELLEKVVPRYPPFGKRMLQDNGSWLAALKRDNVELVTDPISRIEKDAVVCESGERHPVDVIVYATGFHANRFLWPINVTGRGGVVLSEIWGEDPAAYLGITVPGFPNLFCLYGPGTNLAHAGSIIFHSECQVRYIMGCIKALLEGRASSLECRPEVCDEYVERMNAAHARLVWSHPGMNSWYKNSKGRVTTTSPWRLLDYWRWTRAPDLGDFTLGS
jgi:4-hydroxyacetophenone monooxygenase